jgi:phage tail sheath protein FI
MKSATRSAPAGEASHKIKQDELTSAESEFGRAIDHLGSSGKGMAAVSPGAASVTASVRPRIVRADRHESQGNRAGFSRNSFMKTIMLSRNSIC